MSKLKITKPQDSTLTLYQIPRRRFTIAYLLIGLLCGLAWFVYMNVSSVYMNVSIPLIGLLFMVSGLYELNIYREILCTLDKSSNAIAYYKSGPLRSSFMAREVSYQLADIKSIEMVRYVGRYDDRFRIRLAFGNKRLVLSNPNLSFIECQESAKLIHDFIGNDIPMDAVEGLI